MDKKAITAIFAKAVEAGASDVHISVGCPIFFRVNGELVPETEQQVTAEQVEAFCKSVLSDEQYKKFQETCEADSSFDLGGGVRLRINCAVERGHPTLIARVIPSRIPALEELGLAEIYGKLARDQQGLILFTGPTGSGKSTSLAAMILQLITEKPLNVVSLEDPVEFVFPQGKGVVRQRELGSDFRNFPEALRHVLRQDPDVVMVGEMRDPETIALALTLAETGHLIFATLHTPSAIQTIDRIVDVFPAHQQNQIRSQLSLSLRAVVAQRLVPAAKGGRIAVREVLVNTPAAGNIIRDNRVQELTSVLQTNEELGMTTFEKSAKKLQKEGAITQEVYDMIVEW